MKTNGGKISGVWWILVRCYAAMITGDITTFQLKAHNINTIITGKTCITKCIFSHKYFFSRHYLFSNDWPNAETVSIFYCHRQPRSFSVKSLTMSTFYLFTCLYKQAHSGDKDVILAFTSLMGGSAVHNNYYHFYCKLVTAKLSSHFPCIKPQLHKECLCYSCCHLLWAA